MSSVSEYFSGLFGGIKSLLTGMGVTWGELWTKKVTSQYPENRDTLVISDRFRATLVMPHDDNNEHACTSCGICQMNCPNGTIKIVSKTIETEDGKKKKILDQYYYDLGMCTFCNLCVITCPSDAIVFSNNFENAVFNRKVLNEKLNHEGSKLREKKKAVKPAEDKPVAPKAAAPALVQEKTEEAVKEDSAPVAEPKAVTSLVDALAEKKAAEEQPKAEIKESETTQPTASEKKAEGAEDKE